MITPTTTDVHWRARLLEIQDRLFVAHEPDEIAQACLQLTSVLADEWGKHDEPLKQLLREAYDLLTNRETAVDLKDWVRTAERLVGS